jgi:hypothetical protein
MTDQAKRVLTPFLLILSFPPSVLAAPYDANGVALGASEKEIKKAFPSAHCKALEWKSRAAERRCDDGKVAFGGVETRITFYLKGDAVQAFDLRFSTDDLERVTKFLKSRYGKPVTEGKETIERQGKNPREIFKARWENGQDRAVLTSQLEKKRSSLTVSRGDFEEEIYRVR